MPHPLICSTSKLLNFRRSSPLLYLFQEPTITHNPIPHGSGGKNAFWHLISSIAHNPTEQVTCLWSLNSSLSTTVTLKKNQRSTCLGLILTALGSRESPIFKILRLTDFQALDPNFVLALELKVLKLEGSSYGIRPSIYVLKG